jgi:hypothetical protein
LYRNIGRRQLQQRLQIYRAVVDLHEPTRAGASPQASCLRNPAWAD